MQPLGKVQTQAPSENNNSVLKPLISFRRVFGLVFVIVGLSLSLIVTYFTVGPFVSVRGIVEDTEYRLSNQGSQILVKYTYDVGEKRYTGDISLPVLYHRKFEVGTLLDVSYSLLNPNLSTLLPPPPPSPLFLLTGFMSLLGVFMVFSRNSIGRCS